MYATYTQNAVLKFQHIVIENEYSSEVLLTARILTV